MKTTRFEDFADPACIDLRLAPIDIGHDLRAAGTEVQITAADGIASYADAQGQRWVVQGNAEEIIYVLRQHGYNCIGENHDVV